MVVRGSRVEEFDFEFAEPQAAARQYLSSQGHPRRAVAAGGVRRLRRQSPRLPRLQRNPSRLLPDPGRRPAGADRRGDARPPRRPRRAADERRTQSLEARRARRDESASRPNGRARRARANRPAEAGEAACRSKPRRAAPQRRRSRSHERTSRSNPSAPAATRSKKCPSAAAPPPAPLQDPGSHQAPPGHAGAGRQGRARQQGRGADHLSVARRPLFGADAEHRARRRHLAQDHHGRRPQAPEGRSSTISKCRRAWASSCAPPARRAPRPRSSATSNICCGCGRPCAS